MRSIRAFIIVLLFGLLSAFHSPVNAQTEVSPCPADGYLQPRLEAGEWARVTSGAANNLRDNPGLKAQKVGFIPAEDVFRVIDGPRCADGYVWWQVKYDGTSAWTAEGDVQSGDYWLEPLSESPAPDTTASASTPDIVGCEKPPEAYERIEVNGSIVNLRTLAMLDHAQELYEAAGGSIVHFRDAIMQGSYNPGGVTASFGTHDGGGAVDISVRDPHNSRVLTDDIPLLIHALRVAGFAAWLRSPDELYKGSPIHIHAIAIGDAELSEAARGQIDGMFGYLRGYNGLPQDNGVPIADGSGEMVICNWMTDMGYHDMR